MAGPLTLTRGLAAAATTAKSAAKVRFPSHASDARFYRHARRKPFEIGS